MVADPTDTLNTATQINPDLVNKPELAYAASQDPTVDGATLAHSSRFMDTMDTQKQVMESAAKEDPSHPATSFFGDLTHIADSVVKGGLRGAEDIGEGLNKFAADLPSATERFAMGSLHEASNAANRTTQTAVELASGGGARLNFDKTDALGFPTLEGENGKGPSFNPLKGAEDIFQLPDMLGGKAPGQNLGPMEQQAMGNYQDALAKAKADPTPENIEAVKAAIKTAKGTISAYNANPNLQDAMSSVQNVGPVNMLFGKNNVFFMMAHTLAYTESLAAKKGWAYALANLTPAVAVGVLTDGALSADIGVGTAEYDTNLLAQASRLESAGKTLSETELKDVQAAQARQLMRQGDANQAANDTALAAAKYDATISQAGAIRRGLDTAGKGASAALSPVFKVGRGLMAPASDVRMNIMYQAAQAAALGNPEDAELWNKTANYQVYGANGKPMGQDATALFKMMDLDPHAVYFSPLSDVADLADFYTKWLGSDPLGAFGAVVGRARSAEGLKGTLGSWFSGLRITDTESAELAAQQYPRVAHAFQIMADSSAAEIQDRFVGTYTTRQAQQLGRLHSEAEVIEWHGNMAAAGELAKPLAPTFSAFDALKMQLHNSVGDALHINGVLTPQDARWLLENGTKEQLEAVGLSKDRLGSLAANPDVETTSTKSIGRWLGTRLGRNPANAADLLDRESHNLNQLSNDFPRQIMDLYRIALFPEKMVKAVGEIAIDATADERYQLYIKGLAHTADRRMWAGIDHGTTALMKPLVDQTVWKEAINAGGVDGGGAIEGSQMIAGPDGASMTRTYDAEDLKRAGNPDDLTPKAAAAREGQMGHLKFFRPQEMRGLGIYTKQILSDGPTDIMRRARFYQIAKDDIERIADYTNATLDGVHDGIDKLAEKLPDDLETAEEKAGYRNALGRAKELLQAHGGLVGDDAVKAFTNSFDAIRNSMHNLEALDSLNAERHMIENTPYRPGFSERFDDAFEPGVKGEGSIDGRTERARIADLNKQIPSEFPIRSLTEMTPEVERALSGQITALRDVGNLFTTQMADDFVWYDDIKKISEDYNKHVLQNPEALKELNEEWADRFARMKLDHPSFLNRFQRSVDMLNHLQNRTWVPMALFSGAWAFHISVSEGALNTLRNGFLDTYDASLATRIAKHAMANPTDNYFNGLVSDIKNSVIGRFKVPMEYDDEFAHDEGGLVAKSVTKAMSGAFNIIRDTAAGTAMGFERILLSGMDKAARERMLGDFVDQTIMHDGHILNPLRINHVSSTFEGQNMDAAQRQKVYGFDRDGNAQVKDVFVDRSFKQIGVNDTGYTSALSQTMRQIAQDRVEGPIAKELYRRVYAAGTTDEIDPFELRDMSTAEKEQHILKSGAKSFRTEEQWKKLESEVKEFAYNHIQSLPDDLRERMIRNKELMHPSMTERDAEGNALNEPQRDWAKASTYDVMHAVSGMDDSVRAEGDGLVSPQEHVIHDSLLHQVANNTVKDPGALSEDIRAMSKGTEPSHIPARMMIDRKLQNTGLERLHWITTISDYGQHYVFGPIANGLVRDPLYLLSYHQEMEELRATLGPRLSEIEMQTIAESRATAKMIRFVHNPLDKMVMESNLRLVAPFYFAQNQALRRAMRVFREDPGAFEKYLKVSLGVTNWVSSDTKGGEEPYIHLPMSSVIGRIASLPNAILGKFAANSLFTGESFGLSGSPGSVSSMFPTGAIDSTSGIAGNMVRPSGGPFEELTGEVAKALAAHVPWSSRAIEHVVNKAIADIEGPEGAESTFGEQANPSSVLRALGETGSAVAEWAGLVNTNPGNKVTESLFNSDSVLSSLLLTMNNAADNAYKRNVQQVLAKYQAENHYTDAEMKVVMRSGKAAREVSGLAAEAFSKYLQNHQQEFISSALSTNITLMASKAVAAIFSPTSPSITGTFSKAQEFDNLLAEKNPNGSLKYTYDEAKAVYEAENPAHPIDLSARSFDTYGPFPETKGTMDFVTNHPTLVKDFPYASAFLQDANGKYYGPSFDTLVSMGLRQRDTPQDFVNAMLVSSGQQYYKEILSKEYPNNPQGWAQLKQAAITYGHTSNPTWLQYHQGTLYAYQGQKSLDQMQRMVNDKSIPNSVFGGAFVRQSFSALTTMTTQAIENWHKAGSKSEQETIAANWYTQIAAMIKKPDNGSNWNVAPQTVTFMRDVMQDALSGLNG